jgi:kynurenine formamidase
MSTSKIGQILKGGPSNWGKWGKDDEVGAVQYLDSAQVLRGIGAVEHGRVFTLGIPLNNRSTGDPVAPGRYGPQHFMQRDKSHYECGKVHRTEAYGGGESSEDSMLLPLHGTTHFDALGHVWYDDKLFNDFDAATTKGGLDRCSIAPLAQHGVVGRGVLADICRFRNVPYLPGGSRITFDELKACLAQQKVTVQKRDILLIRTAWLDVFYAGRKAEFYGDDAPKPERSFNLVEPGLTYEKEMVQWFHDMEIPALCTDTMGNEQSFSETTQTHMPLHRALIRDQGMLFGEIFGLNELAEDCARDGKYDFMFMASPLKILQGTGSPVNPIVIK